MKIWEELYMFRSIFVYSPWSNIHNLTRHVWKHVEKNLASRSHVDSGAPSPESTMAPKYHGMDAIKGQELPRLDL